MTLWALPVLNPWRTPYINTFKILIRFKTLKTDNLKTLKNICMINVQVIFLCTFLRNAKNN